MYVISLHFSNHWLSVICFSSIQERNVPFSPSSCISTISVLSFRSVYYTNAVVRITTVRLVDNLIFKFLWLIIFHEVWVGVYTKTKLLGIGRIMFYYFFVLYRPVTKEYNIHVAKSCELDTAYIRLSCTKRSENSTNLQCYPFCLILTALLIL